MDPVTHGLIGASVTQSLAEKDKLRPAAATGFAAALLADADIFIHNPADPLLNVEIHRQFSHSLIFIPIGALIAAALVWWFVRKKLSFREVYSFSFLAYATAGIADTFTSYGTKLLWPFIDERFSWNIISVFDPLFSIGILIPVLYAFYRKERFIARIALVWMIIYLSFGFFQHQRGENAAHQIAETQGHNIERLVVKPTIANQLLWSIRYEDSDSLHSFATRLSPFSGTKIYEGESAQLLDWRSEYSKYKGTTLYKDIHRFSVLSEGFLICHPQKSQIIGDGRYAMLPTSMSPLWGIKVDTTQPNQHVPFLNFRNAGPEVRQKYKKMLLGR